jgi:uncharacterized membrane protein YgcG
MDVVAKLDSHGALHVSERQTMIFNGDWNGGERRFQLGPGQALHFERLARVDPDAAVHPLVQGNLDSVDHYDFTDATTLRWRSRLSSEPQFVEKELVYVLEYTLEHVVLTDVEGRSVLRYDLAFADRPGPILAFRAKLEFDPAWKPHAPVPAIIERTNVEPGRSIVVEVPLRWGGVGAAPELPARGLSPRLLIGLLIGMALGLFAAALTIYRHGRARGLFDRTPSAGQLDPTWIREHVLTYPPALVSAVWNRNLGRSAVAATLASMVVKGKLASHLKRETLHLRLLVERSSLEEHEADLVQALFFDGDVTNTRSIREHYRQSGFKPASLLGRTFRRSIDRIVAQEHRPDKALWAAVAVLALGGLFLGVTDPVPGEGDVLVPLAFLSALPLLLIAGRAATAFAKSPTGHGLRALAIGLPLLVLGSEVAWLACGGEGSTSGSFGLGLVWIAGLGIIVSLARTRANAEGIAFRKRLAAARAYFVHELGEDRPRLDDTWVPYLVALGLSADMDRWFRAHGEAARDSSGTSLDSFPFSAAGSSSDVSWTGSGGQSGGGGASGSWSALGAVAAGVSAASASGVDTDSSSSSSSGSDAISGGGGGGGW